MTAPSPEGPQTPRSQVQRARAARNANAAALMTFAAFLGLGFALPFLPLYVQELGVADPADAAQWAGILIGVGPLLAGLLAPFWGARADRHGYKRVALIALVALGVAQIVASLARGPWDVMVSRVLSGLFGGVGPLGLAMASSALPRSAGASKAIGKIQAAQILAAGLGPLLGGTLASALGMRMAFGAAAVSCFLAAAIVFGLYEDEPHPEPTPEPPARGAGVRAPALVFAALVGVVFFVNFASRSFTPILPAQLSALGVSGKAVAFSTGMLISVYSIAAAVSSFGFGRLAARADPARLLGVSLGLSLVSALAMGYAPTFPAFLGLALVFGLVSGGTLTLGYSLGSKRFGDAARGALFGRLSGAAMLGGAVAPALAAFVARSSLPNVYWMNAIIYAALIAVTLTLLREGRK